MLNVTVNMHGQLSSWARGLQLCLNVYLCLSKVIVSGVRHTFLIKISSLFFLVSHCQSSLGYVAVCWMVKPSLIVSCPLSSSITLLLH